MNYPALPGYPSDISDEQLEAYAKVPFEERMRHISNWAHIYNNSTTREERIAHYRARQGENVKYYDTYGWPDQF